MSGFSADWLALRAPFDAAARDGELTRLFLATLRDEALVADLGAGTGSNAAFLRGHAPRQRWRLVESDPELLRAARTRFADDPRVDIAAADLAQALGPALDGAQAVSCSALLDLASATWIDRLADEVAQRRMPALLVLSYDGRMRWDPVDPDDVRICDAFHRDMVRDKGFGPALGPDAVSYAHRAFQRAGARVDRAATDWQIPRGAAAMLAAMVDGYAGAAASDAMLRAEHVGPWRARRIEQIARRALSLAIGHQDLLVRWA
ncbi:MAG: class I SAM-dependent methyltransferase [Alphaproteobacteria bacterium]|nr:class I SAM-dependent methyltransferase [Alphaproteobacteria bacterium]